MICQRLDYNIDQITDIWKMVLPFDSLDRILTARGQHGDAARPLFNDEQIPVEEEAIDNIDNDLLLLKVHKVLSTLSSREEMVIKQRYGFVDGKERTLEEVGKILKVTRERIRQIENKAFRKIKHPSRRRVLYYNPIRAGQKRGDEV